MEVIETIFKIIVLGIIVYVGLNLFWAFANYTFSLSIFTGIGFAISVIVAIYFGKLDLETLILIFVGTVISSVATGFIPQFLTQIYAGELLIAVVYGVVILVIWMRAQEIKSGKI